MYLRDKLAVQQFDSLQDMITFSLRLSTRVDDALLRPDAPAMPVVAAVQAQPAVRTQLSRNRDECRRCGQIGHWARNCLVPAPRGQERGNQAHNPPARGRANFGRYNVAGRVNALAAETDEVSDDELRRGNKQA